MRIWERYGKKSESFNSYSEHDTSENVCLNDLFAKSITTMPHSWGISLPTLF